MVASHFKASSLAQPLSKDNPAEVTSSPEFAVVVVVVEVVVTSRPTVTVSVAAALASFAGIQGLATNVGLTGITVSGIAIGKIMISVLAALLFLFVPATIFVAIKTVFSIAKV